MKRYLQRLIALTAQQLRQTVVGLTISRLTHATDIAVIRAQKGFNND
ncbi:MULTISPECIES: hypothetical protein [unclassified Shewanella]|nr:MULTISPECIES: hypothetical protein [unclassified Shewanella]MBB1361842.1 hypothetical protein [Shewanella sp. SR44-4]QHS12847.1 hypothetical protein GUY17_06800 [Shewanella sp. Arc9-LZ]